MRYLITLTPLEPFFFGGDITFGKWGDEQNSSYLVKSRHFPQQTALLGMLRKQMLIQKGFLTTKRKGEWIDESFKKEAKEFIGSTKFEFNTPQEFGVLNSISSIFLMQDGKRFIKKVDIDSCNYVDGLLKDYNPKEDIYDNFISIDSSKKLKTKDIFKPIEQVGNSKFDSESSLYKKTSYSLKHNFKFAFYIDSEYELEDAFVMLGGEKSTFKMEVMQKDEKLEYQDKKGYLTLLSDAYIDIAIKENSKFAITSEISFNYLQNEFNGKKRGFKKSPVTRYLYEKGSIFIEPSDELIKSLNNANLQKVGFNHYSYKKEEK